MEFNRLTLGIGILILLVAGGLFIWKPSFAPTGLVTDTFRPANPFVGKVSDAMNNLFRDSPQAVVEQDGRVGLLFPDGPSVQFAKDGKTTDQDVVIILNASTTKLTEFNDYPIFRQNEFTFVPADQLLDENPYVRAQYPDGMFLMPIDVVK